MHGSRSATPPLGALRSLHVTQQNLPACDSDSMLVLFCFALRSSTFHTQLCVCKPVAGTGACPPTHLSLASVRPSTRPSRTVLLQVSGGWLSGARMSLLLPGLVSLEAGGLGLSSRLPSRAPPFRPLPAGPPRRFPLKSGSGLCWPSAVTRAPGGPTATSVTSREPPRGPLTVGAGRCGRARPDGWCLLGAGGCSKVVVWGQASF